MRWVSLLAVACFGVLPGSASARRAATPVEQRGIAAAVRTYLRTSDCCASIEVSVGSPAWVSTVNRDFATASITGFSQKGAGPRATAVLVHTFSGRWAVVAFGTAQLACGVSASVRRDLRLRACR